MLHSVVHISRDNPLTDCSDTRAIPSLDLTLFGPRIVAADEAPSVVSKLEAVRNLPDSTDNEEPINTADETERQLDSEIQHLMNVLKQLEDNES